MEEFTGRQGGAEAGFPTSFLIDIFLLLFSDDGDTTLVEVSR